MFLDKLKEIAQAYATAFNPTPEQQQTALKRLQICMTCPEWKQNALGLDYCGLCGCLTNKKVYSPKGIQACPKKRWTV